MEEQQPIINSICRFNTQILKQMAAYYMSQCKSRVDSRLIKQLVDDLIAFFQMHDNKDYAVVPIKNSESSTTEE